MALFSALDVSVRKKYATCTIFSAFCTKPNDPLCSKRPRQSLYINLFHSPISDHLIFRNSLFRKKKRVCVTAYYACVNVHISRIINNDLSHLGGYIYSIGLCQAVSESLQELVRASSSSMLVTLNNV